MVTPVHVDCFHFQRKRVVARGPSVYALEQPCRRFGRVGVGLHWRTFIWHLCFPRFAFAFHVLAVAPNTIFIFLLV